LAYAWRAERNFRLEVMLGLLALALALYLATPLWPIILVSALVLTLELFNTAIEATIDLLAPGYHPLAERAKDTAAAAVLVAAIAAALTGAFLFIPALWVKVLG
jgi:diacylglycerol kinase (ATP)